MPTNSAEGNQSYPHDRVEQLVDRVDELERRVDEQEEEIEQKDERIDELEDEVETKDDEIDELERRVAELEEQPEIEIDDETNPIGSFKIAGTPVGARIASSITEYDWEHELRPELEADIGDSNPTPNGGKTTIQQGDLTPIEQLSQADDVSDVTDSPTVERAVSLFKNLPQWGSKTPKGIVLKPGDNPLSLLEADREESLAWKQYYRAAEALEQLSEGSVTFFDSDRHGKMIVLHEQSEAYDRAINGSLSPSSVEAST